MRIQWRRGRDKGVSWGEIIIPDNLGQLITLRATANNPEAALTRAAAVAKKSLADNPALAALLPPGAGPALKVAENILRSDAARTAGRVGKRVLRRLF